MAATKKNKVAAPAAPVTQELVPTRFVYAGLRVGSNHKLVVALCLIGPDEKLGPERYYDATRNTKPAIGGIYTGASFGESQARGIDSATFCGQWRYEEDRMAWFALHQQTVIWDRLRKEEAKASQSTSDLDKRLLFPRRAYQALRDRGDYAGMEALERAVVRALHKPLRSHES